MANSILLSSLSWTVVDALRQLSSKGDMRDGGGFELQGIGRLGSVASPHTVFVLDEVVLAPPPRSTDPSTPIALPLGSAEDCINIAQSLMVPGDDAGVVVTWGCLDGRDDLLHVAWRQPSRTRRIFARTMGAQGGTDVHGLSCPAGPLLNGDRWQGWVGASSNFGGRLSPSLF